MLLFLGFLASTGAHSHEHLDSCHMDGGCDDVVSHLRINEAHTPDSHLRTQNEILKLENTQLKDRIENLQRQIDTAHHGRHQQHFEASRDYNSQTCGDEEYSGCVPCGDCAAGQYKAECGNGVVGQCLDCTTCSPPQVVAGCGGVTGPGTCTTPLPDGLFNTRTACQSDADCDAVWGNKRALCREAVCIDVAGSCPVLFTGGIPDLDFSQQPVYNGVDSGLTNPTDTLLNGRCETSSLERIPEYADPDVMPRNQYDYAGGNFDIRSRYISYIPEAIRNCVNWCCIVFGKCVTGPLELTGLKSWYTPNSNLGSGHGEQLDWSSAPDQLSTQEDGTVVMTLNEPYSYTPCTNLLAKLRYEVDQWQFCHMFTAHTASNNIFQTAMGIKPWQTMPTLCDINLFEGTDSTGRAESALLRGWGEYCPPGPNGATSAIDRMRNQEAEFFSQEGGRENNRKFFESDGWKVFTLAWPEEWSENEEPEDGIGNDFGNWISILERDLKGEIWSSATSTVRDGLGP